jgi:hypothetical protein
MRVYINNRDYLTWTKTMTEILVGQGHEVIIFDNASTYPPLVDWYHTACPCRVFMCQQNMGSGAVWDSGILQGYDQPYVVTDPDLDISGVPEDWPQKLLEGCRRHDVFKCGLSLEERGVPPENPAWIEDDFCNHPDGLPYIWEQKLEGGYLNYKTGLTFSVYIPTHPLSVENNHVIGGGIRADRPYTATHWPWHVTVDGRSKDPKALAIPMDEEIYYYFTHVDLGKAITGRRLQAMLREYKQKQG